MPGDQSFRSHANASHPLDAVVWNALTTSQSHLAEGDVLAKRFPADLAPFGAVAEFSPAAFGSLRGLLKPGHRVALVTPVEPSIDAAFTVGRRAIVDQMIYAGDRTSLPQVKDEIVRLVDSDMPEMLALAEETQPGPFTARILHFGTYLGIRRNGKLIAMSGERMRLPGFAEISAVCVSPDYRGEGLAGQVMSEVARLILSRLETPFLHVFQTNVGAIGLYGKLGFKLRHSMHLTSLELPA